MQSEASTCADSGDEGCLKALLEKERQLNKEKDARIQQLEARLKNLEGDLEKAQQKLMKKDRDDREVARAQQQELLDELQKRKAVQYELISSSQQLLELQDKVYQQEKKLQTLGSKSAVLGKRAVSDGDSTDKVVPQSWARQMSDSAAMQKVQATNFMRQLSESGKSTQVSTSEGSPSSPSTVEMAGLIGAQSPERPNGHRAVTVSSRRATMSATQPSLAAATQPSLAPRVVSRQFISGVPQAPSYRPSSPLPSYVQEVTM
ncbi:unnamed protein product [Durusdinium trenchii]|uniref:Uncharacterized protein n=1 Tax=Durusdinium trenchii TaxID=1381693 RepID=A0ABP0IWI7_9DINO